MFEARFTPDAIKGLQRMPSNLAKLVRGKIDRLARDPHAPNNNVIKLVGRPGYRLRVGDWRVIYELDDRHHVLAVLVIGLRGSVYE